jgi:hypothetical protein
MEGRWGNSISGKSSRYYVNGKVVAMLLNGMSGPIVFAQPTIVLAYKNDPAAYIFTGNYTKEDAETLYRISNNAPDEDSGYRAILAYMKIRGMK